MRGAEVLDAIGERQDVKRLEGTPAKTTMRFSVSTPQEKNIIIPKWTKVTPDSENYFATDEIAVRKLAPTLWRCRPRP